MSDASKRSIFRWIHIAFGIPIIGYVYSPFKELPNYAPVVRYVALPVILLSGFWMWKGHALRRLVLKTGKRLGIFCFPELLGIGRLRRLVQQGQNRCARNAFNGLTGIYNGVYIAYK